MNLYIQIIKDTWAEYMMYRVNFIMWRVRMVMQVMVTYFLWWAIFSTQQIAGSTFLGYSQSTMLTYVLLTSIERTVVLGTTTMEIGDIINQGKLSNFLVRPMNFFSYYIARDIGDKALNMAFVLVELGLLFLVLRPPIFLQSNGLFLLLSLIAAGIGMVMYFFFSMTLGFLGFWTSEVWAPRFISFVVMEFFAGGLFPLDILPRPLFIVSQALPFSYFVYFPVKVYLGSLTTVEIVRSLGIACVWAVFLASVALLMWKRGLRVYSAEGK